MIAVCSYNFDPMRKRFFRDKSEVLPYWDKENKNDEMEEKEDKEIPECVIVPADSDDEPQPLPF